MQVSIAHGSRRITPANPSMSMAGAGEPIGLSDAPQPAAQPNKPVKTITSEKRTERQAGGRPKGGTLCCEPEKRCASGKCALDQGGLAAGSRIHQMEIVDFARSQFA